MLVLRITGVIALTMMFLLATGGTGVCADKSDTWDVYRSSSPLTTKPPDGGWQSFPATVADGADLYLGIPNVQVDTAKKTLKVTLEGSNLDELVVVEAVGFEEGGGMNPATVLKVIERTETKCTIRAKFTPQPDWERIHIRNLAKASYTITSATAVSECVPVPSLTVYGIIVLAIMLAVSTIWILRRRKAGVTGII